MLRTRYFFSTAECVVKFFRECNRKKLPMHFYCVGQVLLLFRFCKNIELSWEGTLFFSLLSLWLFLHCFAPDEDIFSFLKNGTLLPYENLHVRTGRVYLEKKKMKVHLEKQIYLPSTTMLTWKGKLSSARQMDLFLNLYAIVRRCLEFDIFYMFYSK